MSHRSLEVTKPSAALDLALVAQRILTLAEICVLDQLAALDRSQAVGLSRSGCNMEEDNGNAERCR